MRQVSYGRIRLGADQKQVSFANEGQETGLICVGGAGVVSVGSERFTLKRDDALYVPKGLSITVETASELDLVECSAPVEGEYPLQFVSGASVRRDEKLHFVAGTASAHREINILLGSNIQAGPVLTLALPLILAELGWMSMGIVDTMMVGHMANPALAISAAEIGRASCRERV